MVQHLFIIADEKGEPTVSPDPDHMVVPHTLNIYRDDQYILWKIIITDWGFVREGPAFVFDPDPMWTGSNPAPVGDAPAPGELDRRNYVAAGPGAANDGPLVTYVYTINIIDKNGHHRNLRRVDPVDPDIGNQPQP
jgi:hypothetical protein